MKNLITKINTSSKAVEKKIKLKSIFPIIKSKNNYNERKK